HSSSAISCLPMSSRTSSSFLRSFEPADADLPAAFLLLEATLLVRFLNVSVIAGIDLDHIAFLDVEGNLHHRAWLDLRGLGATRYRVTFERGVRFSDFRNHESRKFDA